MERFKIYKGKKGYAKFMIVLGGIFLILGIFLIINSGTDDSTLNWSSVPYTLQGILFIFLGYVLLRSDKYFIEWDEVQMNYLLPNMKSAESILFSEIRGIKIKLFEIQLDLEHTRKTLNLENLQFEEIRSLKQKFEDMKTNIENKNAGR
jgi:hypothetical protein